MALDWYVQPSEPRRRRWAPGVYGQAHAPRQLLPDTAPDILAALALVIRPVDPPRRRPWREGTYRLTGYPFERAVAPLSWAPILPAWRLERRRVRPRGGLVEEVGAIATVPRAGSWRPQLPSLPVRRRRMTAGARAWVTVVGPVVSLPGLCGVRLRVDGLTTPDLTVSERVPTLTATIAAPTLTLALCD